MFIDLLTFMAFNNVFTDSRVFKGTRTFLMLQIFVINILRLPSYFNSHFLFKSERGHMSTWSLLPLATPWCSRPHGFRDRRVPKIRTCNFRFNKAATSQYQSILYFGVMMNSNLNWNLWCLERKLDTSLDWCVRRQGLEAVLRRREQTVPADLREG
jgi:hypothetical protein